MRYDFKKLSAAQWYEQVKNYERLDLIDAPTPVQLLFDRGSNGQIWVKRDDLSSSVYGGNKVRKLEYLLAGSKDPVVTVGALGSHHVLATALHAKEIGRQCAAILVNQPITTDVEKTLSLIQAVCHTVVRLDKPVTFVSTLLGQLQRYAEELFKGKSVQIIPPGGSTPEGTLGYVLCGLELCRQIENGECPAPSEIYVALGTGGTAIGLALGLLLGGVDTKVIGVRVASKLTGNRIFINHLAKAAFNKIRPKEMSCNVLPLNIEVDHGFIGKGYGHATKKGTEAISLLKETGVPIESTYTAKAFAALLERTSRSADGAARMFLDTYAPIDNQYKAHFGSRDDSA